MTQSRWAKEHTQADHYYLVIADHANGLAGISWDYTSAPDGSERLTNGELRQALRDLLSGGDKPLDVLHLDACLMGLIEGAYQFHDAAHYLVTSENEAWAIFAYDKYRASIGPLTSPRELAEEITRLYAREAAAYPYTIAALDLSQVNDTRFQVDDIVRKTDVLAGELLRYALASPANRDTLMQLRAQVQKLDSNGNITLTNDDAYIDLRHWAELLIAPESGVNDSGVHNAAIILRDALQTHVIEDHHTGTYETINVNLDHAHGVAIYYPHQPNLYDYRRYLRGDLLFPRDTRWGDFLVTVLDSLPLDNSAPQLEPVPPRPIGR